MRKLFLVSMFLIVLLNQLYGQSMYSRVDIITPDTIWLVQDRETILFWDAITNVSRNISNLDFWVNVSNNGIMYNEDRGLRAKLSSTGTYSTTISAYDNAGNRVGLANTYISVVSKSNGTGTKNFLSIGDSRLSNETMLAYVKDCFTTDASGMAINFVGTQGSVGLKHEGRSGWGIITGDNFTALDTLNPFYNSFGNTLDFQDYITSNSLSAPDIIYISLGINDLMGFKYRLDSAGMQPYVAGMVTLISAARSSSKGYPNAKIIIGLEPYYSDADGLAANYFTDFNPSSYKYNMRYFWRRLINTYTDSINVRFSMDGVVMDRVNGYPSSIFNASDRDSVNKYVKFTNGVHSNALGYKQIGISAVYPTIRSFY